MGEIVITHNKAIKVILLRKTLADMGSTLQQGGIGRRAPAIFQIFFPFLLPAAQGKWTSTFEKSKEETSDKTKEGTATANALTHKMLV